MLFFPSEASNCLRGVFWVVNQFAKSHCFLPLAWEKSLLAWFLSRTSFPCSVTKYLCTFLLPNLQKIIPGLPCARARLTPLQRSPQAHPVLPPRKFLCMHLCLKSFLTLHTHTPVKSSRELKFVVHRNIILRSTSKVLWGSSRIKGSREM